MTVYCTSRSCLLLCLRSFRESRSSSPETTKHRTEPASQSPTHQSSTLHAASPPSRCQSGNYRPAPHPHLCPVPLDVAHSRDEDKAQGNNHQTNIETANRQHAKWTISKSETRKPAQHDTLLSQKMKTVEYLKYH